MFDRLINVCKNVKKITANELALTVFVVPEVKLFIVKLNIVDQLYTEGVDVNDKVIGTYSYLTAIKSNGEHYVYNGLVSVKKYGEPYTFYDTGQFYESFKVIIKDGGFVISANTVKEDKDLMSYGDILGLDEESKQKLQRKMLPLLRKSLREYLLK
jgi:hypothetical protein